MTESEIIEGLKTRDVQAFKALVKDYSDDLTILAYVITKDRTTARTIVDNVLIDVWNKVIQLSEPIYPFLKEQVRTACGY
jgi:ABC-type transporter Mla maintaining outer membrane lipid asymmetry ATPase subunit MlaF